MNCSSPLAPPAGRLREWSFSDESTLPKYLLVWLLPGEGEGGVEG